MSPHVLLSMMLAAPAPMVAPPNPNVQRLAFTRCISEILASDLHANTAVDAFRAKLETICQAEAEAFRQASIRSDIAVGIKAAAAQDNAAAEIKDIRDTQAERYKSYFDTKTYPK